MSDTHSDAIDAPADEEIARCLNLDEPTSFFLYAGAGSGKTRSLVTALNGFRSEYGNRLALSGQAVGVITYTNAACDEIKQRLEFDPLVSVSTIHAFSWDLIGGFNHDIREWLRSNLATEIEELHAQQAKGRPSSQAYRDRARSIETKSNRLASLDSIQRFIYSPSGDNRTRDSLNHSEVISITANFLEAKPGLQRLLISKFPILLIDESQDTNRHLMDALLTVQRAHSDKFCLGLFGDTMQRIYADGKADLAEAIPESWAKPVKRMNHRCPRRVIELINQIRSETDAQQQLASPHAQDGHVRLFLVSSSVGSKQSVESYVAEQMAGIAGDEEWTGAAPNYKSLALEHQMAARRYGFEPLLEALSRSPRLRTALIEDRLAGLNFFADQVLPIVHAIKKADRFAICAAVRKHSPFLSRERLAAAGEDQIPLLRQADAACQTLGELFEGGNVPSFLDVLDSVSASGLLAIPDSLSAFVSQPPAAAEESKDDDELEADPEDETETEDEDDDLVAWRQALKTDFRQVEAFKTYISGASPYDTHQGVKGLEFPRVMVIVSDDEARGFLFSYGKLFGAKEPTDADLRNEREGKDSSIDRTRRLFYVTCSRAESSLAVVYYTEDAQLVADGLIERGWFRPEEVLHLHRADWRI